MISGSLRGFGLAGAWVDADCSYHSVFDAVVVVMLVRKWMERL